MIFTFSQGTTVIVNINPSSIASSNLLRQTTLLGDVPFKMHRRLEMKKREKLHANTAGRKGGRERE